MLKNYNTSEQNESLDNFNRLIALKKIIAYKDLLIAKLDNKYDGYLLLKKVNYISNSYKEYTKNISDEVLNRLIKVLNIDTDYIIKNFEFINLLDFRDSIDSYIYFNIINKLLYRSNLNINELTVYYDKTSTDLIDWQTDFQANIYNLMLNFECNGSIVSLEEINSSLDEEFYGYFDKQDLEIFADYMNNIYSCYISDYDAFLIYFKIENYINLKNIESLVSKYSSILNIEISCFDNIRYLFISTDTIYITNKLNYIFYLIILQISYILSK
ncbi:hypothetical protein [Clostridium thermobutyricum]|uniref:hypothetical protein n=1 Tax=Clostridium thermobutyricum TaxID=29372 RepID=UPI0018AC674C|nr:hypothetical protein [Clostridium thermobutyricum]